MLSQRRGVLNVEVSAASFFWRMNMDIGLFWRTEMDTYPDFFGGYGYRGGYRCRGGYGCRGGYRYHGRYRYRGGYYTMADTDTVVV